MTVEIKINGILVESYYIANQGAPPDAPEQGDDPGGERVYRWERRVWDKERRRTTPGGSGTVPHVRRDGAVRLVQRVLTVAAAALDA